MTKFEKIKVGDAIVIENRGDDYIGKVIKKTAKQIVVKPPFVKDGSEQRFWELRFKEGYSEKSLRRVGKGHGTFKYCDARYLTEEDDALKMIRVQDAREIKRIDEQRKKQTKEKEAAEKKQKEYEAKVAAFWAYKGKEMWESKEQVGSECGKVFVLSFANGRSDKPMTVLVMPKVEEKPWYKGTEKEGKLDYSLIVCGFVGDGQYGPSATNLTVRDCDSIEEAVYDLVHW